MMNDPLGAKFAHALASKDRDALLALLSDEVDFKALTPRVHWDADSAAEVVDDIILGHWFDADDHIEHLLELTAGRVGDREHLAYRFQVRTGTTRALVEQQVYYQTHDDQIVWLRILCSGYSPSPPSPTHRTSPDRKHDTTDPANPERSPTYPASNANPKGIPD